MTDLSASSKENLEDVLFKYLALHERWGEDRQDLAKQNAELAKLLHRFTAQVDKFKDYEQQLNQQIAAGIYKAAQDMSLRATKDFISDSKKEIESLSSDLSRTLQKTTDTLNHYQKNESSNTLWIMLTAFIMPIVVSLLIVFLLTPKPTLPLTDQQMLTYQNGQFFNSFWGKLSKQEQKRLTGLANAPNRVSGDHIDDGNG